MDCSRSGFGRRMAALVGILGLAAGAGLVAVPALAAPTAPVISTYAGGPGSGASSNVGQDDQGIAVHGTTVYLADTEWNVIRALNLSTGQETVVAGNGISPAGFGQPGIGGPATAVPLEGVLADQGGNAVAVDGAGDVFFADHVSPGATDVMMVAATSCTTGCPYGLSATTAGDLYRIATPADGLNGLALDGAGNLDIVNDGNLIQQISVSTGAVTTIAGNDDIGGPSGDGGPALDANLGYTTGAITVDPHGDILLAETANYGSGPNVIRMIAAATCATGCPFGVATTKGDVYTVAGGGSTTDGVGATGPATGFAISPFNELSSITTDATGDLFFSESSTASAPGVKEVAAAGDGLSTWSTTPLGFLATDTAGDLYGTSGTEVEGRQIQEIAAGTKAVTTVAGYQNAGGQFESQESGDGGLATNAELYQPQAPVTDAAGDVYVADQGGVREISAGGGTISTVAGGGTLGATPGALATKVDLDDPNALAVDPSGDLFIADSDDLYEVAASTCSSACGYGLTSTTKGDIYPIAASTSFVRPFALALDAAGDLFVADGNAVLEVTRTTGAVTTFAGGNTYPGSGAYGNVPATQAYLFDPDGLAFDAAGDLYIADGQGFVARVDATSRILTVIAGNNGSNGGSLAPFGTSGQPASGVAVEPYRSGLAIDAAGDLYVDEQTTVQEITTGGTLTTVAGDPDANLANGALGDGGPPTAAQLYQSTGVAVDASGDLFIADTLDNRLREVSQPQPAPTAAPSVTGLSVASGTGAGGTSVTISGTGFTAASTVQFGTTPATGVTLNADGSLTATAPPGSDIVDVRVSVAGGQSPLTAADEYSYSPDVTGVGPSTGSTTLAQSVTITGDGLSGATGVTFGDVAATSFHVVSATQIVATDPLQDAGAVDVTVATPAGTSATSGADQFTYQAEPALQGAVVDPDGNPDPGVAVSVCPASGTPGNCVQTTTDDTGVYTVTPLQAGSWTVQVSPGAANGQSTPLAGEQAGPFTVSGTAVTQADTIVLAPLDPLPHNASLTGTVDVSGLDGDTVPSLPTSANEVLHLTGCPDGQVTYAIEGVSWSTGETTAQTTGHLTESPVGSGAYSGPLPPGIEGYSQLTYQFGCPTGSTGPVPTVTTVTPDRGPAGGNVGVTITGTGFTDATQVNFGAFPAASFRVVSATQISVSGVPAGEGTVDVTVAAQAGTSPTSAADRFTYGPVVTGIATADGSSGGPGGGGRSVVLTGAGFTGATAVSFGARAATGFTVVSPTEIVATSPAGGGTVGITVTTPIAASADTNADRFTYAAPQVTGVNQTNGPGGGGSTLVLTGSGFTGTTTVVLGGVPTTNFTVLDDTDLEVTTPAHAAATVDTIVNTPAGASAPTAADHFIYNAPSIASLSEASGGAGDQILIQGNNLTGATAVHVGAALATGVSVVSDDGLTATVPSGTGTAPVTVTTPGGTSPSTSAAQFTYAAASGDLRTAAAPIPQLTGTIKDPQPVNGSCLGLPVGGTNLTGATTVTFAGPNGTVNQPVSIATPTLAVSQTIPVEPPGSTVQVSVSGTANGVSWTTQNSLAITYANLDLRGEDPTSTPWVAPQDGILFVGGLSACGANDAKGSSNPSGVFVEFNGAPTPVTEASGEGGGVSVLGVQTPDFPTPKDVRVTIRYGNTTSQSPQAFTFQAPQVSSVNPSSGPESGGGSAVVEGKGFTTAAGAARQGGTTTDLSFGPGDAPISNIAADALNVPSVPAGTGTVRILALVENALGESYTATGGSYRYTPCSGGTGTSCTPNPSKPKPTPNPDDPCNLFTHPDGCSPQPPQTISQYHDPSGTVVNQAGQPVAGATVTLLAAPTPAGTYAAVPDGSAVMSPANRTNPQTTGVTGTYGWDVLSGYYAVTATAPGCTTATSTPLTVPPPVTGYQLTLTCPVAPPTASKATPLTGPTTGGTAVTVTGTGFGAATQVSFGPTPAASVTVNSATSLTAVAPAAVAGPVAVTVATSGGSVNAGTFTYGVPAPVITTVTPNPAPPGTVVTLTGSGFTGATAVTFGSVPATQFTVVSDTQITAVVPENAGSTVSVTTPGGTTAPIGVVTSSAGYRIASANGAVAEFGADTDHGSMAGQPLAAPIVGSASTPDGKGYWLVGADGGVFAFGDAGFFGSAGNLKLTRPVVGMAATPDGKGYWLVASDGGVFAYGDAGFFGSAGNLKLTRPVVGMAASPDGKGYWLVASDGGVFTYGAIGFYGSEGGKPLTRPVVGMGANPSGQGYWLVASDGGVFTFGSSTGFYGSAGAIHLVQPVVGMLPSPSGHGYWLVAADGGIFNYGDAAFEGSASGQLTAPAVGLSP